MEKLSTIFIPGKDDIINAINGSKNSVFIVGDRGSGKTTFVNEYLNSPLQSGNLSVDGTVKNGEYLLLVRDNIYELYHVCLIVKKILLKVIEYNFNYSIYFSMFLRFIENLITQISFDINNCFTSSLEIDNKYLKNPELLIEDSLIILSEKLDIKTISLIIDNFDAIGDCSKRYQEFIYNKLRDYLKLIMVISDKDVVEDETVINKLGEENKIIKLNYSKDVEVVTEILSREACNILMSTGKLDFRYFLRNILNEETILLMITKTNGNLFKMLEAIRMLYRNIYNLNPIEYQSFILNYIDEEINKDSLVSGIVMPKRILHIR